ncbi:MAG TPA: arylsulfatase [Acidobacteriota bacterium]|nr:arylsulfatase [Acidobacteriota bacterium]
MKKSTLFTALFLTTCALTINSSNDRAANASTKPNIVFVLADDLGYGELGCYGQTKIRTPNIDRMASEGMRFTSFYTGCPVCAPSRCTLMTGKHLGHAVVRDNMQRGPGLEGQHPMDPGTVTVAQILKRAGYATAIVGKWGLGMPEDHSSPLDFGFDHHYGYLCQGMAHTYYPPYLWRDNHKEMLEGNPPYLYGQRGVIEPSGKYYSHDLITQDALAWVRAHRGEPFFLYLAFTIQHLSLQVPEDSLAEYKGKWPETPMTSSTHYANHDTPRAAYAAMITRMDRDVGRLMGLIRELGLDDRTLVFFASDNGAVFPLAGTDPEFFHSNGNLRGYKEDLYEGGIRTPFIARWTGRIKAGATSPLAGAFWDMLPTLCDIAGTTAPTDIDGVSITPTLLGRAGQKVHEYLYWEYYGGGFAQAVRFGNWKSIRNNVRKAPESRPELYNLADDPGEKIDVSGERPDLVEKAAAYMKAAHRPSREPKWNF